MIKKCFKCGIEKDLSMFYVHPTTKDGYLGKCIECTKEDATKQRNKNIEYYRAYDRQRSKLPHRKRLNTKIYKKYKAKYPIRQAATTLLNNAVRSGKLIKPKICSVCQNKTKIMGHHVNYYKPLEVIWACQPCHKILHKETKP